MALIRNGYAGSTRREFLGVLLSALVALALFDPGSATAQGAGSCGEGAVLPTAPPAG
jgi:hypothetical protein